MNRRRGTTPVVRLALLAGSVAVGLLVLELGVRAYSHFFFHKMMQIDPELGWKHAPSVHRTFVNESREKALVVQNANGQRGRYYERRRIPGKFRVLVLGDSFMEGCAVGEEDLFTGRLERGDSLLEVLNAGVSGYGTIQEDLYLEDEGVTFSPDLVLVMFYENDLVDNSWSYEPAFGLRPYGTLENGQLRIVTKPEPAEFAKYALPAPFLQCLNRHSYLYEFLNTRVYHRLFSGRLRPRLKEDLRRLEACPQHEILYGTLDRMRGVLQLRRIDMWVVLIPSREEVQQGSAPRLAPIVDFCDKRGIRCIPLLDPLKRASAAGARPYFAVDVHWTKAGHRIAAEAIGDSLRSAVAARAARGS